MKKVIKKKKTILKTKIKKEENIKKDILSPEQRIFCELYYNPGEFFSNATWAYIKSHNYDIPMLPVSQLTTAEKRKYKVARSAAYQALTSINIIVEGKKILKSNIHDNFFDNQMVRTASQDKDWASKMAAVKEYNQLKSRILKKIDLTSEGKRIQPIIEIIHYGKSTKKD